MRKQFLMCLALIAIVIPSAVDAASVFGGRITIPKMPAVTCNPPVVFGPFYIAPSGGSTGPYVLTVNRGIAGVGKWILGLYQPIVNVSYCHTQSDPPVPVPVYVVGRIFGLSR